MQTKAYVLGIDFGGGASKATLMDETGAVCATAIGEYPTASAENGLREQNPADWIRVTLEIIAQILEKARIRGDQIKVLCFDAATHTAVLTDESFRVVRPSVYWTDTRCVEEKKQLLSQYGEDIFRRCKHKVDTIWTLPELLYLKNSEPDIFRRVKRIMFSKDYVRHFFTADFVTDFIEAQGSMFYDYDTKDWAEDYLALLGLDRSNLPKLRKPDDIAGYITAEAAAASGLAQGTPVLVGSTDTAMEVFASGAVKVGEATLKLATAGRFCMISDHIEADEHLVSYSHIADGLYYPGTATKACASSLRWFRDTFGGEYPALDALAAAVPIGAGGLIYHPYLSGELTPYANPALRGDFVGISFSHTKGHFVRSVLEGVAMSIRDSMEYLIRRGYQIPETVYAIGGGSKSPLWRQIVSDALGITLVCPQNSDSSFGSAMLAGVKAGFFRDIHDALRVCRRIVDTTVPNPENKPAYDRLFARYKRVQRALEDFYNDDNGSPA